ncbi:pathogenesis-related leaf protein 6-like [Salvia hispanica]|uniref:pathogenesis-related leaf protein 6-like n=1 Tax=Salvia hispanica TaxID=49212 RepID=UPI002009C388|nr:pathogenesis-related leaf protein 6-like [Salvia hispanica]
MKMKKNNNFPLANILFNFLITMVPYSCLGQNSRQDYINVHNAARAKVGVGPIMWSEKVASFARNYARQRVGDCNLIHSTNRPYGENLAKGGEDFTGSAAVDLWVKERPNYIHTSNSCVGGQCLHYTQVVWRNSTHVGCARVRCNDGWWFISCNYDPPGNYIGQRPY